MDQNPYSSPTAENTRVDESTPTHRRIVARYRWTVEEFLETYRWHARQSMRRPFRIALNFAIALILLIVFFSGVTEGPDLSAYLCIAFGVYFFVLRGKLRTWRLRRHFDKRSDTDVEIEWAFTPDEIHVQSTVGKSELSWKAFEKLVQVPNGVLLYSTDTIFHWLPTHAFANDSDFDDFIRFASAQIPLHRVLS